LMTASKDAGTSRARAVTASRRRWNGDDDQLRPGGSTGGAQQLLQGPAALPPGLDGLEVEDALDAVEEHEGLRDVVERGGPAQAVAVGDGADADDEDEGGQEEVGLAVVLLDVGEAEGEEAQRHVLVVHRDDVPFLPLLGMTVGVMQGCEGQQAVHEEFMRASHLRDGGLPQLFRTCILG